MERWLYIGADRVGVKARPCDELCQRDKRACAWQVGGKRNAQKDEGFLVITHLSSFASRAPGASPAQGQGATHLRFTDADLSTPSKEMPAFWLCATAEAREREGLTGAERSWECATARRFFRSWLFSSLG